MSVKEKNLHCLMKLRPDLYKLYDSGKGDEPQKIVSNSGHPVFRYKTVAFHSLYKPESEGEQFVRKIDADAKNVWVYGVGYGYQLSKLLGMDVKIKLFEPSVDIFRSAVENVDITGLIEKCDLEVGGDFDEKILNADLGNAALVVHRPYLQFFGEEYKKLESTFLVRSYLGKKRLRTLLVGPIYGGSEPTFRYAGAALKNLGVDLIKFDSSEYAKTFFKLGNITPNRRHGRQLKELFSRVLGEAIVGTADHQRPDLIIAVAQAPLEASIIDRLKELKVPIVFWFVENYRTLPYWESVASHYDYFFTIQRGGFFEKLEKAGATKVGYLPQAASPSCHTPLELTGDEKLRYGSDLSFMGAGYPNRRQFFNGLLDYDFKIWGTEWELEGELGERVMNKNVRLAPEEYVKIFNASKINLNLHSSSVPSGIDPVSDFVNPRVFEVAACGAFSLVDSRDELPPLMEPGKEIETFSSLAELREKADYYLRNPDERKNIANAGRKRVLADHTFEHRMVELLRVVMENEGGSLGSQHADPLNRNVVRNMIKESTDDPELIEYLKRFDPDKEFPIKEAVEQIRQGKGKLSHVESLILMMDQLLVVK
ncbi:MAG: glycosyltransferase [Nitrospinota bacterium]